MSEIADDLRPWVPEGARPFAVGDRVRVALNGECRFPTHEPTAGEVVEHYPAHNGMMGKIIDINPWFGRNPDHPLLVATDEPVAHEYCHSSCGYFAPSELELIEEAAR